MIPINREPSRVVGPVGSLREKPRQTDGRQPDGKRPTDAPDFIAQRINHFLEALPSSSYQISIKDRQSGTTQRRSLRADRTRHILLQLATGGMACWEIHVRPNDPRFVQLPDASAEVLDRLSNDSWKVAFAAGAAPGEHVAWIDLGADIDLDMAMSVARRVAEKFGDNLASAGGIQLSRLLSSDDQEPIYRQSANTLSLLPTAQATNMKSRAELVSDGSLIPEI